MSTTKQPTGWIYNAEHREIVNAGDVNRTPICRVGEWRDKPLDGSAPGWIDFIDNDVNGPLLAASQDLLDACKKAYDLIDALMPGVAHIALQDYRAMNETPIAILQAIAKAEPQPTEDINGKE